MMLRFKRLLLPHFSSNFDQTMCKTWYSSYYRILLSGDLPNLKMYATLTISHLSYTLPLCIKLCSFIWQKVVQGVKATGPLVFAYFYFYFEDIIILQELAMSAMSYSYYDIFSVVN